MRAVNLLPPQLAEQRASRVRDPRFLVGLGSVVVVLAALVLARHSASSTVASRQSELADLQAQIALASRKPVAQPAQPAQVHLSGRSALVLDAVSKRANWDRLLRELALVLPNDVWLSDLKAQTVDDAAAAATTGTPDAGSAGFSIEGSTYSQAAVARLLSRLQMIPDLSDVRLEQSDSSTSATGSSLRTVQFTISANVVPIKGGT